MFSKLRVLDRFFCCAGQPLGCRWLRRRTLSSAWLGCVSRVGFQHLTHVSSHLLAPIYFCFWRGVGVWTGSQLPFFLFPRWVLKEKKKEKKCSTIMFVFFCLFCLPIFYELFWCVLCDFCWFQWNNYLIAVLRVRTLFKSFYSSVSLLLLRQVLFFVFGRILLFSANCFYT